jgi:serine/threonine-protein kinase
MGLFTNYDIEEIIAEGDMATVYKCIQSSTRRPVAVKVLSQQLMNQHPGIAKDFEKQSLALMRLSHPGIVRIIDRGMAGGLPYFVMEYVDATPLSAALETNALDLGKKLDVAMQVCKAMSYAHRNGVIHRHLKPANVLIDKQGVVHVTDFGIAQLINIHSDEQAMMGAADYMSPEQKLGKGELTAATDTYSLGVIMYEMFTGQLPGEPLAFPSYHDVAIPAYLDEIITTCLKPIPGVRYVDAGKVKEKLLDSMWGAHLPAAKKKKVLQGMGDINTRFVMLDVIKETNFSAVYLCENTVNHNRVVIKKVSGTKEGYKESTMLSNLRHPDALNIFGTSTEDDAFNVVMEYLAGGSLSDRLVNPWPWQKAVSTIREICQGMVFIHANNLVHGNLRPSNILFTKNGQAKVADCSFHEHYGGDSTETNWYGYPNQPKSKPGDIYAVGAILLEMVCGLVPTWKKSELVVNERFHSLPGNLQIIIKRMVAIVPRDRYGNFEDVIRELNGLTSGESSKKTKAINKSPFRLYLLLLLLLAVLAALASQFPEITSEIYSAITGALGIE